MVDGRQSFGEAHPELVVQWHPTKNGDLTPFDIAKASNKKVWWICHKGHEWQATVGHRHFGSGCPFCSNRIVLEGYNDFAHAHPELATQWHPTMNGRLTPLDISIASNKKVWWICDKGHKWQAPVHRRIYGHGCPICSNRKVETGFNDFAHEHPELMFSWDYERNAGVDPEKIVSMSDRVVWWKCECGHTYRTSLKKRSQGTGCPRCSAKGKALRFIQKHASDFIERFRKANKNHDSIEVLGMYVGARKRIKCRCKVCGNTWESTPAYLLGGSGCPWCVSTQTSFQEQFICLALKHKLGESNVISRDRNIIGMELDILVLPWKFAIEIGGWHWHKDNLERDKNKFNLCKDKGIELMMIYDNYPSSMASLKHCRTYVRDLGAERSHRSLKALVQLVLKKHGGPHVFTNEEWDEIAIKAMKASRRSEGLNNKPMLSQQGQRHKSLTHEEFIEKLIRNGYDLTKITFLERCDGRNKRIKCRCNICGNEWSPLARALLEGHGCKICGCKRAAEIKHQKFAAVAKTR